MARARARRRPQVGRKERPKVRLILANIRTSGIWPWGPGAFWFNYKNQSGLLILM